MKTYNAPTLVEYGEIGALTGVAIASTAVDQSFDENGDLEQTLTGSLDRCYFVPGTTDCIISGK